MQYPLFDIFDEHDLPLEKTATYDDVHTLGLWHRGVHVLIYTPEKKIVMQKRSPNLRYHPGEVEVSVGGGVDSGETPAQAAVREAKEELGVTIQESHLNFVGKTKFNHATKDQLNRCFIYSYSVCVPEDKLRFTLDPAETTLAFLMPERQLRTALRRHRIRNIGKITSTYAYWNHLLDSIKA